MTEQDTFTLPDGSKANHAEVQLLIHLRQNPPATRKQLVRAVGWSRVTTNESVDRLRAAGLLKPIYRPLDDSQYTVTDAGKQQAAALKGSSSGC